MPHIPIATYDYIGDRLLKRAMLNGVNLGMTNGSVTHYDAVGRPTPHKDVRN